MCLDEFKDITYNISDFQVNKDFILETYNNTIYNNIIIEYYKKLQEESRVFGHNTINNDKIKSIEGCNKMWLINTYHENRIKDFVSTNLCKDKFCNNCKKVKQAVRLSRYIPLLSKYKDNLYHIVFTQPNVCGKDLEICLKKMSSSFSKLIRIIRGNYRCFIDFSKYGFLGSVRSFETTFKKDVYHPHFHCAFAFNNLVLDKKVKNQYSYSNCNNEIRLFSEFEIILQKLWYMLYNDIPITENNFNILDIGYSVICDKFKDDDYIELFKYMTKSTNEDNEILTYDNFKALYYALYNKKQIQGYGCFYNITDDEITENEIEKIRASIRLFLDSDEQYTTDFEYLPSLLVDNEYTLISRKSIYEYLKKIK